MKKSCRGFILSGLALLIIIMLFSCSYAPGDVTGDRVIAVSIGGGSTSRLIQTEEYEVTSVGIEIIGPCGPLEPITWVHTDGAKTYYIQAQDLGEHEIIVTHTSDENGTPVTAVESAFFRIVPMLITVINITPGAIGVINILEGEEELEYCDLIVGTWAGEVEFPVPDYDEFGNYTGHSMYTAYSVMTFECDGSAEMFTEMFGEPLYEMTMKGIYECEPGILNGQWTYMYNPDLPDPHWELMDDPIVWSSEPVFSDNGNTVTIEVEFQPSLPHAVWVLTRQ